MSYIKLRGRWYDDIVLDVHATAGDTSDDAKSSFHEETDCVFRQVPKHCMKILLGCLSTEVRREYILKPTNGSRSFHEIINGTWVTVVRFAISEILIIRS
jgi:hypothetical protein